MTALVLYDSAYGNTARIAEAIRAGLGDGATVHLIKDVDPRRLVGLELLVIGSPTQGGRPTPAMLAWLDELPAAYAGSLRFAAFDTRIDADRQVLPLRLLMGIIGYAAQRIAASLVQKGAQQMADPKGFVVTGKEGPLAPGELERARAWAAALAKTRTRAAA